MASKPNGSVPTAADYARLKGEHDELKRECTSLKGQVTKLTHKLQRATAGLDVAVQRTEDLKAELAQERANRPELIDAAARDAIDAGQMRDSDPRWKFRSGATIQSQRFANQAEEDAVCGAEPDRWFDSRGSAEIAWREAQMTPLPDAPLDGQTEAEATA